MKSEEFFFHLALARAARKIRKTGCNVHVFRDSQGFVATEFLPVGEQRREWLRVRTDGVIEEGATRCRLGTLQEFGLRR